MIQIGELVFENDDIGTLAIHLGRTRHERPAVGLPVAVTAAGSLVVSGGSLLYGYSITNTDGANPVTVIVHDSADTNGPQLLAETLAVGVSITRWLGRPGLLVERGLFVASSTTANVTLFAAARGLND